MHTLEDHIFTLILLLACPIFACALDKCCFFDKGAVLQILIWLLHNLLTPVNPSALVDDKLMA